MPYHLVRSGLKYYVENTDTGRKYSNRPIPKERAARQMRALYAAENGYILRSRSKKKAPFNVRRSKLKSNSKRFARMTGGKTRFS